MIFFNLNSAGSQEDFRGEFQANKSLLTVRMHKHRRFGTVFETLERREDQVEVLGAVAHVGQASSVWNSETLELVRILEAPALSSYSSVSTGQ